MAGRNGRRTPRKSQIKDYMDEILESKSFYRKHCANDDQSLFRAISDGLFGTQRYRNIVAKAADLMENEWQISMHDNGKERPSDDGIPTNYILLTKLAERFRFNVEVVCSVDKTMMPFRFHPKLRSSKIKRSPVKKLLLCFTPPNQFDPIYHRDTIETAGVCQSILYELLYTSVFEMFDAMEAAGEMLYGDFEGVGKPDILVDPDYDGTAMDALEQNLIPFPYKVAKCLDPTSYRNIEYDVWTCEKLEAYKKKTREQPPVQVEYPPPKLSIGRLEPESPCLLRFQDGNEAIGFIIGPLPNRHLIEVYVPTHEQCVYVERSAILPLKEVPPEYQFMPRRPDQRPRLEKIMYDYEPYHFRMSPPHSSSHEGSAQDEAEAPQENIPPPPPPREQERPRPPPLDLTQTETETWEFEHYAGCYTCQSRETTPLTCPHRPMLQTLFGSPPQHQPLTPQFPPCQLPLGAMPMAASPRPPPFYLVSPIPIPGPPLTPAFHTPIAMPSPFVPHGRVFFQVTPTLVANPQSPVFVFPTPANPTNLPE